MIELKCSGKKNAWVDSKVMREMATRFVEFKIEKHGHNTWIILFCDNLSAHLDDEVKEIFSAGKVFLCYFPPAMTEIIQPIDAGYGRSLRCEIGNLLDEWLMDSNHLAMWERRMSASERRVLVMYLVGEANAKMVSEEMDDMRIGCFRRTGCLISRDVKEDLDNMIKPQGVTVPLKIPCEQQYNVEAEVPTGNCEDYEALMNLVEGDDGNGMNHISQYLQQDEDDLAMDVEI